MGVWSKIILGGIGWAYAGPLGAIVGVAVAYIFSEITNTKSIEGGTNDTKESPNYNEYGGKGKTTKGDFLLALMVLAGAVMKADGSVVKSELEAIKSFLRGNFTEDEGKEALQILKQILKTEYSYRDVCRQIDRQLNYSGKLELLHLLFKIASADKVITQSEINTIYEISHLMGITDEDYSSIKVAYRAYTRNSYSSGSSSGSGNSSSSKTKNITLKEAYELLQIPMDATDDEVKKAYRRMAMKYHPDKVNTLGEEVKRSATEKFKALGEAYQMIKDSRGLK